jgi:hypothetical protein
MSDMMLTDLIAEVSQSALMKSIAVKFQNTRTPEPQNEAWSEV